jgi:hypothetical protein
VREHEAALAHGVDRAGEAEVAEIGQEFGREQRRRGSIDERREVGEVVGGEAQPAQVGERGRDPGGDRVATLDGTRRNIR